MWNNAHAGDPMVFGNNPHARSSDTVYHECSHNVLYHLYGDWVGFGVDNNGEGYAFDEGFADYFAITLNDDSTYGEGSGGGRNHDNLLQYPGKDAYNIEGHSGGRYIGGAMWDLRTALAEEMGHDPGVLEADGLAFEAHQLMGSQPREYFFSDPQESNFLTALYLADDTNGNLADGVPHFVEIHRAFANHGMLQAVLENLDSYDVSANQLGWLGGGDFYVAASSLLANNVGQRGLIDLGDAGDLELATLDIPANGYTRMGAAAVTGNTYVSLAQQGEEGNVIALRVLDVDAATGAVTVEYDYHSRVVTLADGDSYDFDEQLRGRHSGGDFYLSGGKFWANNAGQRGLVDVGNLGGTPLESVGIPDTGYGSHGVTAAANHTYVSLAATGEEGHHVVFRVQGISGGSVTVEAIHKRRNRVVLYEDDGYDFSQRTRGDTPHGDFYLSSQQFWANNAGQQGLVDVGNTGATALTDVAIPAAGFSGAGVALVAGHTYVARAATGEAGAHIVFEVDSVHGDAAIIDYELIIAEDGFEPASDSASTAPGVACGDELADLTLHSPTDVDYYELTIGGATRSPFFGWGTGVDITLDTNTPGIEAVVLDASLDPVSTANPSAFLSPSHEYALSPGTYYVRVTGTGTPGGYELDVSCGAFYWKFRKPLVRIDDPLIIIPELWFDEPRVVRVPGGPCPGGPRGYCVDDSYAFSVKEAGVRELRIAAEEAPLDVVVRRVDIRDPQREREAEEVTRTSGQREHKLSYRVEPGYLYVVTVTSKAAEEFEYSFEVVR